MAASPGRLFTLLTRRVRAHPRRPTLRSTLVNGVRSEVGRLRTVLLHRPGNELRRLTPRNNDALLFDGIPWVDRAQEEHDGFAEALKRHKVDVLYLSELLVDTLADRAARNQAIEQTTADLRLGDQLRGQLHHHLAELSPDDLALVLMAGLRNDEVRFSGLVTALRASDDFLIDPLPNLLFTRDSSVWVSDRVTITSLAMPARRRETQLTELIYTFHPRFVGTERLHGWNYEHLEGGDVLALADGVLAIGVGQRTTAAGVERLARTAFDLGLAHSVLAVPIWLAAFASVWRGLRARSPYSTVLVFLLASLVVDYWLMTIKAAFLLFAFIALNNAWVAAHSKRPVLSLP